MTIRHLADCIIETNASFDNAVFPPHLRIANVYSEHDEVSLAILFGLLTTHKTIRTSTKKGQPFQKYVTVLTNAHFALQDSVGSDRQHRHICKVRKTDPVGSMLRKAITTNFGCR